MHIVQLLVYLFVQFLVYNNIDFIHQKVYINIIKRNTKQVTKEDKDMKKYNRMNPLTEKEADILADAALKLAREEKVRLDNEVADKIASGEWIEKDGKLYDARYFRG